MDEPVQTEQIPSVAPKRGVGLSLVVLLLLLLLGFFAYAYYDTSRRLALLESRLDRLPRETIDAIVAYQNGDTSQASALTTSIVSIDNDAFIGDRENAPLAIIEFSDFNCPYCARFHAETYEKILDKYVRSGQAIYVYRDYIGVGGNVSLAAAAAAECLRAQTDDQIYLTVVRSLYGSSGTKNVEMLKTLAQAQGVDMGVLESCISADTYRQEVLDDTRAGQAAGARGTPAFIIGKLNADGTVSGETIPGAQPFEYFDAILQKQLAKQN